MAPNAHIKVTFSYANVCQLRHRSVIISSGSYSMNVKGGVVMSYWHSSWNYCPSVLKLI